MIAGGYRVSDDWAVHALWEHLSHGGIIGEGKNQGLDSLGVRFARTF